MAIPTDDDNTMHLVGHGSPHVISSRISPMFIHSSATVFSLASNTMDPFTILPKIFPFVRPYHHETRARVGIIVSFRARCKRCSSGMVSKLPMIRNESRDTVRWFDSQNIRGRSCINTINSGDLTALEKLCPRGHRHKAAWVWDKRIISENCL